MAWPLLTERGAEGNEVSALAWAQKKTIMDSRRNKNITWHVWFYCIQSFILLTKTLLFEWTCTNSLCSFGHMFVGLNWILKPVFFFFFFFFLHWHLASISTVKDLPLFLLQTTRYLLSAVLTAAPQPGNGVFKSKIIFALKVFSQAFNSHDIRLSVWKYQLIAVAFLIKRSLKRTEDFVFLQHWEGAWWWITPVMGRPTSSELLSSRKKSVLLQHGAQREAVIYPASWQSKLPYSELWAVFSVPRIALAGLIWCPSLSSTLQPGLRATSGLPNLRTPPGFSGCALHSTSPWMPEQ